VPRDRRRRGLSAGPLGRISVASSFEGEARLAQPWELPGIVAAADPEEADWLINAIDHRWVRTATVAATVGMMVPDRFEAYARILHPAPQFSSEPSSDRADLTPAPRTVRWEEVAAWSGRIIHAGAQFHRVITPAIGRFVTSPDFGVGAPPAETPHSVLTAVATVLAQHTATLRQCWFALWDGYGDLQTGHNRDNVRGPARLRLPARTYLLYSGPLSVIAEFATPESPHSPTLWWPQDRAWFVGSDPDLDSTYLGGSAPAVQDLLAEPGLELVLTNRSQSVAFDADDLNAGR